MWGDNITVRSHHAGRPAKQRVNGGGYANPTTAITFVALPMLSGCGSGARCTQAIGDERAAGQRMRPRHYKNP